MFPLYKYSIPVLLFFGVLTNGFGQIVNTHDFNVWTGLSVEKKLVKKLQGEISIENRLHENASQLRSNLIQTGIRYKTSKKTALYSHYRFTNRPDNYSNRVDFRFGWKDKIVKRTYLTMVFKTQFDKDSDNPYWDSTLRFKWDIEHKIKSKKLFPYFSNEWFYDLSETGNHFYAFRLSSGISYKLYDNHKIDIGYTYIKNIIKLNTRNILGISYKLDL